MSAEQLRLHYGRHHRAYVDKLNKLVVGTMFEGMPLDEIIRKTADDSSQQAIFNNAAQHYNHSFFWKSIQPWGSNMPPDVTVQLEKDYGSVADFEKQFCAAAMNHFGSGWVWAAWDSTTEKIEIVTTANAGTLLPSETQTALIVLDVWEHAWYNDFENEKAKYVNNYFATVDWHWFERHWKRATKQDYYEMKWL
jgi:Fe-Mn family superoxide dismutase